MMAGALTCACALPVLAPLQAADWNGDGLSDVFQRRYVLPAGPDALTRDTDLDGRSDAVEFLFGTNPIEAASVPPTKPQVVPSGVFVLRQAVPGALYGLEVSTNLRDWSEVLTPAAAPGGVMNLTVIPPPGLLARKYYRFVAPSVQPDADADTLNVIEEALLGSSDNDSDSDDDGLPDGWEARYGLNLLLANAGGDPDNDGLTNLQEFQADTDPTVTTNFAPLLAFVDPAPGHRSSAGTALTVTVSASDPDATDAITEVMYFDRGTSLGAGQLTGTPGRYSLTLSSPTAGERIILARARDGRGGESWAAVPVSVTAGASELAAYGPIEGGMAMGVSPSADDLRSLPFTAQPAFAGAVGSVASGVLTFDEEPAWIPGYFQSGYFLYVRSGTLRGAVLPVTGNDVASLTVTGGAGLSSGDLIAVVPKQGLAEVLPQEAVHNSSKVYIATAPHVPAATGNGYYQRGVDGLWHTDGAGAAVSPVLEPWSCFRIIHETGAQGTAFQPIGDVASGPVRVSLPAHSSAQSFAFAHVSSVSLSLRESGLSDAGIARGAADVVEVRMPGAGAQSWTWKHRVWTSASGSGDGAAEIMKPGGAMLVHRAAPGGAVVWTQAASK